MSLAAVARGIVACFVGILGCFAFVVAAPAADLQKVVVGKAIISSFPFSGLDLGVQQGIWKSVGLDLQIVTMSGDGKLQQALAAGSVQFGVGSGPGMGYAAKGVPARAVAVIAKEPANMALVVSAQSKVETIADLKGKMIGVTTAGSLTDWLVRKISAYQGWDPSAIVTVPMGDSRTRQAAMQTGQIAGAVTAVQEAYRIQDAGQGKILMTFGKVVPDFYTHVIYARDEMIDKHPDVVRAFLKGWFETAAFMRTHRAETVASIAKTMNVGENIVDQTYDIETGMLSRDGVFDPKAMNVVRNSLQELGILESVPAASAIYSDKFVPVSIN
jgi:NitT/TauT family transport system substrate-binding protein